MSTYARFSSSLAAAFILAASVGSALAHDNATLDSLKSAHGGQTRMAGPYHFELVLDKDSKEAKDQPVLVYLTDHAGTKIPSTGVTGTATILSGKIKSTTKLASDGDNRLKGDAKYASTPDVKVVLSITLAGKSAEQARFTPFAIAKDGHMDHSH